MNPISLHPSQHLDDLRTLMQHCTDYSMLIDGHLPSEADILQLFQDVPPNFPTEKLQLLGYFEPNGQGLQAAIWFLDGYPDPHTIYIGLLLVDERFRQQSLGKKMLEYAENWGRANAHTRIRLGVADINTPAKRFWAKNGFIAYAPPIEMVFGLKTQQVHRLEKSL